MDLMKQAVQRIREFFAALSTGQRVGLGACCALVVVSLVMVVALSGKETLVPLTGKLSPEETSAVLKAVEDKQVRTELQQGVIYVPADQKERLLVDVYGQGLIADDSKFYNWLYTESWTDTDRQRQMKFSDSNRKTLQNMIAKMQGIQAATIRVTEVNEAEIYFAPEEQKKASASVTLTLRGADPLPDATVTGIARLIAGAVRRLDPKDVTIMDTRGRYYPVPDLNSPAQMAWSLLQAKREMEKDLEKKVMTLLATRYAKPLPIVTVNAILNMDQRVEDKAKAENDPYLTKSEGETEVSKGTGEEPGVQPNANNLTASAGSVGGGTTGTSTSRERTSKEFKEFEKSHERTHTIVTPGKAEKITASVVLPREMAAGFKFGEPVKEADVEARQARIDASEKDVQDLVAQALGTDKANITVKSLSFAPPEPPPVPTALERFEAYWALYGTTAVFAGLALAGMIILWRMVKRMHPGEVLTELDRIKTQLEQEEQEAAETLPTEVLELRAKEFKEGIRGFVSKNPRGAAALIKRWIKQT